ncbi:hypothetical protein GCM10007901_29990 [Dyella acidisoli]|uniref:RES domain-containing protein n=1 Tax=Dyella acidisoli TaxID=1867834 RepID=A0ABQ5XUG4_9GAMM|nr:hypothetical protein GCM10007901_29990 [Dyella acidisoli]
MGALRTGCDYLIFTAAKIFRVMQMRGRSAEWRMHLKGCGMVKTCVPFHARSPIAPVKTAEKGGHAAHGMPAIYLSADRALPYPA